MSEPKHSPGPWILSDDSDQWRINSDSGSGYCVTSIPQDEEYGEPAEDEANGHLIAAAPEMLEVLKLARGAVPLGCAITRDRIDRAIAMAEGTPRPGTSSSGETK